MQLLPPITREQLAELESKYPRSMKCFEEWTFQDSVRMNEDENYEHWLKYMPLFEDLPPSWQLGLWIEFVRQQDIEFNKVDDWDWSAELYTIIEAYFVMVLEPHLTNNS